MPNHSEYLKALAERYLEELGPPGLLCAWVGGSVGRGEADAYSDLDLSLVVEGAGESICNLVFGGEIIQVHTTGVVPGREQILADPWGSRFLLESVPVFDPRGQLTAAFDFARDWYRGSGLAATSRAAYAQAKKLASAASIVAANNPRQGAMAARAALCEMAAMGALARGRLDTMSLLTELEELTDRHGGLARFWPWSVTEDLEGAREVIRRMERLRSWARQAGGDPFTICWLQDMLMARKGLRLIAAENWQGLSWLFYCEAEDLFFSSSEMPFDQLFGSLPAALQADWEALGFSELSNDCVQALLQLADCLMK